MDCPNCGRENRAGVHFCVGCGRGLAVACPSCGAEAEAADEFCGACGQSLDAAQPKPAIVPPVAAPTPASFASGRYQVQRFVGEGAKKRVYLAHDTRLDRDVAIGVIKTEGLDEGVRIRVRREAQAMGRLGDHPHIVTVHDISEEDGQLFIVSQYMGGGDVTGLLAQSGDGRVPIPRALEITRQVCSGLEHAHARGNTPLPIVCLDCLTKS